jgi:hypothetical protein
MDPLQFDQPDGFASRGKPRHEHNASLPFAREHANVGARCDRFADTASSVTRESWTYGVTRPG